MAAGNFYGGIGGTLPWGSGGGSAFQGLNGSDPLGSLANNYSSGYNSSLAQNQAMYGNIMAGYQGLGASQQNAQNDVNTGWANLTNQDMGLLATQGQNQAQQIQNQFTASGGALQQSDVNRGLGNTTVADSEQRGNNTAAALALNNNAQNYSGLQANALAQLGSAGLNQQANAYAQNTALGLNQLGFMNTLSAPYPNPVMYGNLAQQYGNRGHGGMASGGSGSSGGAAGLGYMPTAAPGGYDSGTAMTGGNGVSGGFGSWAGSPTSGYGGSLGAYGSMDSGPAMGGYGAMSGGSALVSGIGAALGGYGGDYGGGGDWGDMGDYGGGGDF